MIKNIYTNPTTHTGCVEHIQKQSKVLKSFRQISTQISFKEEGTCFIIMHYGQFKFKTTVR